MKPVHQTDFGKTTGNCFAACIASLFDLPLEEVPNFCGDNPGIEGAWFREANRWLKRFEVRYIEMGYGDWVTEWHGLPGCLLIAAGPGPRGCDHCIVLRDGEMVHDPHPSAAGLTEIKTIGLFVPTDPARLAKEAT